MTSVYCNAVIQNQEKQHWSSYPNLRQSQIADVTKTLFPNTYKSCLTWWRSLRILIITRSTGDIFGMCAHERCWIIYSCLLCYQHALVRIYRHTAVVWFSASLEPQKNLPSLPRCSSESSNRLHVIRQNCHKQRVSGVGRFRVSAGNGRSVVWEASERQKW